MPQRRPPGLLANQRVVIIKRSTASLVAELACFHNSIFASPFSCRKSPLLPYFPTLTPTVTVVFRYLFLSIHHSLAVFSLLAIPVARSRYARGNRTSGSQSSLVSLGKGAAKKFGSAEQLNRQHPILSALSFSKFIDPTHYHCRLSIALIEQEKQRRINHNIIIPRYCGVDRLFPLFVPSFRFRDTRYATYSNSSATTNNTSPPSESS